MDEDLQKELTWAFGSLFAFIVFLLFAGITDIYELGIVLASFVISWLIISYSIKTFGTGSSSKEDIQEEFKIFSIILVLFLGILTVLGVKEYTIFAIATGAFTITWAIRSAAIKKFS